MSLHCCFTLKSIQMQHLTNFEDEKEYYLAKGNKNGFKP